MRRFTVACHPISALVLILLFTATTSVSVAQTDTQSAFRGQVFDADGSPIAGADVFVTGPQSNWPATKSDAEGRFTIPYENKKNLICVVYQPGLGIEVADPASEGWGLDSSNGRDTKVTLGEPSPFSIKIEDSSGKPAVIKKATVSALQKGKNAPWRIDDLSSLPLPVNVDGDLVSIDWLTQGVSASIQVETENDIPQELTFPLDAEVPKSIKLIRPATLTGTVTHSKEASASPNSTGEQVSIEAFTPPFGAHLPSVPRIYSRLTTTPDEQGRFEFTTIAGVATITIANASGITLSSKVMQLIPAETNTVDLFVEPPITIRGRCVDEDGQPVEGVIVSNHATTNHNGEFELSVPRQQSVFTFFSISNTPAGYQELNGFHQRVPTKKELSVYTVPDIEIRKSRPISGKVVDPNGMPVPNANVDAIWPITRDNFSTYGTEHVRTDEQGNFKFTRTDSVPTRLTARTVTMASTQSKIVRQEDRETIRLEISELGKVKFTGTITDTNGKPIPNAIINLRKKIQIPDATYSYGSTALNRNAPTTTDKLGRFQYPLKLSRIENYELQVNAKGFVGRDVDSLRLPDTGNLELNRFALAPTRSVSGTVVDSKGNPIPDVRVWSYGISGKETFARTLFRGETGSGVAVDTDSEGRFSISDLHSDAQFVFADKTGYQMAGKSMQSQNDVQITMRSSDEPGNTIAFRKLDPETKRKALRRIFKTIQETDTNSNRYRTDQKMELQQIADRDSLNDSLGDIQYGATKAQWFAALGHHADAYEICVSLRTPRERITALVDCARRTDDHQLKLEYLKDAGSRVKNLTDNRFRLELSANIIGLLLDYGGSQVARDIADLVTPSAITMSNEGRNEFSKAWYAKAIAQIDAELAWELIKESRDSENKTSGGFARHAGNVAYELAATDSETALKIFSEIPANASAAHVQKVAVRMASVDPNSAIDLMDSFAKARSRDVANGFGTLAMELHETDPAEARRLLQNGINMLLPDQNATSSYHFGCLINLMRFEIKINQGLSPNLWRFIETISDPNDNANHSDNSNEQQRISRMARQALFLTLFDLEPEICESLLDSIFSYFESLNADDTNGIYNLTEQEHAFAAMALHDPERTAELHESLYPKIPSDYRYVIQMPWLVSARTIALDTDSRIDYLAKLSSVWIFDDED